MNGRVEGGGGDGGTTRGSGGIEGAIPRGEGRSSIRSLTTVFDHSVPGAHSRCVHSFVHT